MNDEYTYWIYYLNNEIYAYTDNKKYAKKFESVRDMKVFQKVKKDLSKNQLNYLADEHQSKYLKEVYIDSYDESEDTYVKIDMVMTTNEEITIYNMSVQIMEVEMFKHCWFNPVYFDEELYSALKELGYVYCYQMISDDNRAVYEEDKTPFKPDLLGIFLKYYGDTMKK